MCLIDFNTRTNTMDELKIKNLSKKIVDVIKTYDSPTSVYYELCDIAKKQEDYFRYLGPENLIKLTIYLYSLKKTKSLNLADKLINNLLFAELVSTENEQYYEECTKCDVYTSNDCNYCDGTGEINSEDEVFYTTYSVVTWNKVIQDACELRKGTSEPMFSENEFQLLSNDCIILNINDINSGPLNIIEDEMYCIFYSDDPKLEFTNKMQVSMKLNKKYISQLYK